MATVFLNGVFVEHDAAMVSAFDAGFQHGVGLFETMLAVRRGDGWEVLDVDAHLDRLAGSCRELRLTERLRVDALREAVVRAVARAGDEEKQATRLRVRLTITGGDLNLLQNSRAAEQQSSRESGKEAERQSGKEQNPPPTPSLREGASEQQPTLLIVATRAVEYPAPMFEKGVRVTIADWKANPLDPMQGHKTLNYWGRLRELQGAGARGAAEALVFQVSNYLCGGCVSNAMVVKGGRIVTPIVRGEEIEASEVRSADLGARSAERPEDAESMHGGRAVLPSPVLPGVTRRWAIDWAEGNGIEVERRMVNIDDVLNADEVLLTNSSWGVLPVAAVESRVIGAGRPGEVGTRLVEAWSLRRG